MRYRSRFRFELILLILAVFGFGATFGYAIADQGLFCPTLDSCGMPEYHDGGWYIAGKRVTQ